MTTSALVSAIILLSFVLGPVIVVMRFVRSARAQHRTRRRETLPVP